MHFNWNNNNNIIGIITQGLFTNTCSRVARLSFTRLPLIQVLLQLSFLCLSGRTVNDTVEELYRTSALAAVRSDNREYWNVVWTRRRWRLVVCSAHCSSWSFKNTLKGTVPKGIWFSDPISIQSLPGGPLSCTTTTSIKLVGGRRRRRLAGIRAPCLHRTLGTIAAWYRDLMDRFYNKIGIGFKVRILQCFWKEETF